MTEWIFLGDAHFNPFRKDESWRALKGLARGTSPEGLVLMGDLFDFWFGFDRPSRLSGLYSEIEEALAEFQRKGTRIIFLEGNHDFYLRGRIGGVQVESHRWEATMHLGGQRLYLAHGDRAAGPPYNLPSLLLKNPLTCRLLDALGPGIVTKVAFWWSAWSRRNERGAMEVARRLRRFAEKKIREGFDVVILAHSHQAEASLWRTGERVGRYFNVGSWHEGDYLRWSSGRFRLEKFADPGPQVGLALAGLGAEDDGLLGGDP